MPAIASSPATDLGSLKFTNAELAYLHSLLEFGDRGGFYIALYNMTGQEECLLQARIATFSDAVGGAAFSANFLMQSYYGQERYPGVYFISQSVAVRSLMFIERELAENRQDNSHTGYLSQTRMFSSAQEAWELAWHEREPNYGVDIRYMFPGNLLANEVANFVTSLNMPDLPNQTDAWTALVNLYEDLKEGGGLTPENFTNRLISSGTLAAAVAALGAAIFGKTLEDYEDDPLRYTISYLPGVSYAVVTDATLGKVVAVCDTSILPVSVTEALSAAAANLPLIFAALIGGPSGMAEYYLFQEFLVSMLSDFRRNLTLGMPGFDGDLNPRIPQSHGSGSPSTVNLAPTILADTLWGSTEAESIDGLAGDDRISAGGGNDTINGGAGDDLLYGQAGNDDVHGGSDNDVIRGGAGDDTLHGDDGSDSIDGDDLDPDSTGNDQIFGGAGNDTLSGGAGNDLVDGGTQNDSLFGGNGNDTLIGGEGNDYLQGGGGTNEYIVGVGNDRIFDDFGQGTIWWTDTVGGVQTQVLGAASVSNLSTGWQQLASNVWVDSEHGLRYTRSVGPDGTPMLVVTRVDGGSGELRIESFYSGDFGITLPSAPMRPAVGTEVAWIEDEQHNYPMLTDDAERVLGSSIADEIYGFGGADWIEGGLGRDRVQGGVGNDFLFGFQIRDPEASEGLGDGVGDLVDGGNGDDLVVGDQGADLLFGGGGADVIYGGAGDDNIMGDIFQGGTHPWSVVRSITTDGNGITTYVSTLNNMSLNVPVDGKGDVIFAGAGDDWVSGNAGNDHIDGGADNDVIWGGQGADVLLGGSGNDVLVGSGAEVSNGTGGLTYEEDLDDEADVLDGGIGNDRLYGRTGNDYLVGGDGNDTLWGGIGNDEMLGGADDDLLAGEDGDDFLDGGEGVNTLSGGAGNDQLRAGAGNDDLSGNDDDDTLEGGAGDDSLFGGSGNDILFAGDGVDLLVGGAGNDEMVGGDGNDELQGDETTTAGAEQGDDLLDGGLGNDLLVGFGGSDTLIGGEGDDELQGDSTTVDGEFHGNDLLNGGAGNDNLFGFGGDDTLDGGEGDDSLYGDAGDLDASYHGNDVMSGGSGADYLNGMGGDDTMSGGADADTMHGGAGNDSMTGDAGSDQLYAQDGNDTVSGGDGDDRVDGDDGNDMVSGDDGADFMSGGNGDDTLYGGVGNDTLSGDAGNDILDGGAGNDYVIIGGGADRILWGWTSGYDVISGYGGEGSAVVFGTDVLAGEVSMYASGNDLVIERAGGGGGFLVVRNFGLGSVASPVSNFEFADGTIWNYATILAMLGQGGYGNDTIAGFNTDDILNGGAGDDKLYGLGGNDVLNGGYGNDSLWGDVGNDTLNGGDGNDVLYGMDGIDVMAGGAGIDSYDGGAGADIFVYNLGDGSDSIVSSDGTDILRLGAGITPGMISFQRSGNDLLIGIGSEVVYVTGHFNSSATGLAAIEFDGGTVWSAVDILTLAGPGGTQSNQVGTSGNDTFTVDHPDDTIVETVNGGIDLVNASVNYVLPTYVENLTLTGTYGWSATGNAGDNVITGNGGNNSINGGEGNDTAYGGLGDDSYQNVETVIELAGGGYDTVYVNVGGGTLQANVERMIVNSSSAPNQGASYFGNALDNVIEVIDVPASLVIDGGAGADTMIYRGPQYVTFVIDNAGDTYQATSAYGVTIRSSLAGAFTMGQGVRYFNAIAPLGAVQMQVTGNSIGNNIDMTLAAAGSTVAGGDGDDVYVIGDGITVIETAAGGTDRVDYTTAYGHIDLGANIEWLNLTTASRSASATGNALDNYISGNTYGNHMDGGAGNDTIRGSSGNDWLDGGSGTDLLQGGAGADTYVIDSLADVIDEEGNTSYGDTVYASFDYTLDTAIENLTLTGTAINGTGTGVDNILTGNAVANVLTGDAGNDWLKGEGGNDTLWGGADNDQLSGGDGADVLDGGIGNDWLYGDAGDDQLLGGDGNDNLQGGEGNDSLQGGLGNDSLIGGSGNDTLVGGGGADTLVGGNGDDTYRYNLGDGSILIDETGGPAAGSDILRLGVGIGTGDVVASYDPNMGKVTLQIGAATISWYTWGGAAVDYIDFDNGTRWDVAALVNQAPQAGSSVIDLVEGQAFSYVLSTNDFYDDEALPLTYQLVGTLPAWVTFNATTGTFSGTAPMNGAGFQAQVRATDHYGAQTVGTIGFDVLNAITGTSASEILTGTSARDVIYGLGGNDTINGGAGVDWMIGGLGNDTYTIDSTADFVDEAVNGGTDSVSTSVGGYGLAENVENLTLTGTAGIGGYGNDSDNVITGNSGANYLGGNGGNDRLDGLGGSDTLDGGQGDDIYTVADAGDVVVEDVNAGNDTVRSSRTYTLTTNVENLELTGTTALSGTGNVLDNHLLGNSAANTLSGSDGNDWLEGFAGADTLNGGNDMDTLDGGLGNDSLTGGNGDDLYLMARGSGQDTVVENNSASTSFDTAKFLTGVTFDQLWFRHPSGSNNLEISIIGTTDKLIIKNWYLGAQYKVEVFRTVDGNKELNAADVETLVTAMAALTQPTTTTLSASYQTQLASAFASAWHSGGSFARTYVEPALFPLQPEVAAAAIDRIGIAPARQRFLVDDTSDAPVGFNRRSRVSRATTPTTSVSNPRPAYVEPGAALYAETGANGKPLLHEPGASLLPEPTDVPTRYLEPDATAKAPQFEPQFGLLPEPEIATRYPDLGANGKPLLAEPGFGTLPELGDTPVLYAEPRFGLLVEAMSTFGAAHVDGWADDHRPVTPQALLSASSN